MARTAPAQRADAGSIRDRVLDVGLTVLVAAVSLAWAVGVREERHVVSASAFGVVLALWSSLPLLVRRRWPVAVLAAVESAVVVGLVQATPDLRLGGPALVVAMFTVATRSPRPRALGAALAVAGCNGLVLVVAYLLGRSGALHDLVADTILVAGAWAIGDNIGTRRAYLAALEERAERLEREQTVVSQRAALAERARIARELHDVVAHHVSAIAVQAGAAEELAERDPARARAVLATIQATSREALAEMRAVVGVLREEGDGVTLAPQPGLGQLAQLAAQSRSAGLDVRVRVDGPPAPLPDALDVCAYRIIQEALTNTLKHAGATRAEVTVRYTEDGVELSVVDDGGVATVPTSLPGAGRGLVGMRERVALFRGRLDAGRIPGGGFRVVAHLPTGSWPRDPA
ncbi:MAG TPA: sensor histidine kinase [Candidatus Dormibacteraeota bacterium]|jgi:signal transduction histidine kinase